MKRPSKDIQILMLERELHGIDVEIQTITGTRHHDYERQKELEVERAEISAEIVRLQTDKSQD